MQGSLLISPDGVWDFEQREKKGTLRNKKLCYNGRE